MRPPPQRPPEPRPRLPNRRTAPAQLIPLHPPLIAAPARPPTATGPRVEAVDALRGVAALTVVVQHGAELLWPGFARWSVEVFRPGEWGVLVFFLISGFVIPLSLERERDPVSFWIGRAWRLFPLYWLVLTAAVVAWRLGHYPVARQVDESPLQQVAVNLTMTQHLLASSNIIGAAWSLAYELVFYLFITVLLVAGATRAALRSTVGVLCLSCSAGLLIPPVYLLGAGHGPKPVLVTAGVTVAALAALWGRTATTGGWVIGAACTVALVVLVLDQPLDLWFSLLLLATIGCGWVYHEAHRERLAWWVPPLLSGATVLTAVVHLRLWVQPHEGVFGALVTWRADAVTLAAAHVAFGLLYLARYRPAPALLRWLGAISYSVYLVHAVVINSFHPFPDRPVATLISWIVLTVGLSAVTYRLVELPAQRTGRRLRARWRHRSSAVAGPAAPVSPVS